MRVTFDEPNSEDQATAATAADADAGAGTSGNAEQGNNQWCPACALTVPLGYVTCPKCKTRLPGARLARPASGTSVVAGARRPMWLLLVLAMAGAAAIYYHFVADSEPDGGIHRRGAAARAAAPARDRDAGPAEVVEVDGDARPPATEEDRAQVLAELVDALGAAGIEVTAVPLADDEGIIVLRSETCDAEALAAILRETEASLSGADFRGARCFSPAGILSYQSSW